MRERLRRWAGPAAEAALGVPLCVMAVVELSGVRDRSPFFEALGLVLALASAMVLARRLPLVSVGIALSCALGETAASSLLWGQSFPITPWLATAALSFLAGLRSERIRPMVAMVVTACTLTLALYLLSGVVLGHDTRTFLSGSVDWLGGALSVALSTLTPWLFGRYRRLHRRVSWGGWEVAERMERTRAAEAARARLRERAGIAARMHDSLGHDLALIAVRAAALEMASPDGSEQAKAAGGLRAAAHEANLRLREIIGVLREDTEETSEPITALVQRAVDAGMSVRLLREGPDPDPTTPCGRAVHRVVQEALTNAAKYAPGSEVTVRVVREPNETRVCVDDTGFAEESAALPARGKEGSGLAGSRSLVEELGGDFTAGPEGGSGFTVRATVPDSGIRAGKRQEVGELETWRTHGETRARARRRLLVAVTVPVALGLVVTAICFAVLTWVGVNSVLPPARYDRLVVGDDRAEVERVLPRFSYPERSVRRRPPAPAGAECFFYLVRHENGLPPVYRLCFADGVLVAKDEIRRFQ